MRFKFDKRKSEALRRNPKRGIGFEEAREVWESPYYLDQRSDVPEQWRAIGWVGTRLFTVIYEERSDREGEYVHLVTLWKSTKEERRLYEKHA
ncbi:MAG TPA: BrnT family toxin [bacterium]|nr:BrnT family toxin [bacterium]